MVMLWAMNQLTYASIFTNEESNNVQGYSNEEVNKLFKEASVETDSAKRGELYKEIQQK